MKDIEKTKACMNYLYNKLSNDNCRGCDYEKACLKKQKFRPDKITDYDSKEVVMKKADADIYIQILVECPHCEESINLMNIEELKEDGYIYSQLLCGDFGKENWEETVECPDCKKEFVVGNVVW